jgi:transposase
MAKLHFRPYIPDQTLLYPSRMDEDIAANDPVRIVNALVDSLNLSEIMALYKEYGRSPYHPHLTLTLFFL